MTQYRDCVRSQLDQPAIPLAINQSILKPIISADVRRARPYSLAVHSSTKYDENSRRTGAIMYYTVR